MMRTLRFSVLILGTLAIFQPAPAAADIRATAFGGTTRIEDANKGTLGVSAALGGLIGFEFDAARIWLGGIEDFDFVEVDAYVTTYMFNAVVRLPTGPIQPYGSAGAGIVRVTGNLDLPFVGGFDADAQDVGWNVGGGLYLIPTPIIGFRFDVRRFQTGDLEWEDIANIGDLPLPEFTFWRYTAGVTIKF
jgi:opacity protein-like surface antigen